MSSRALRAQITELKAVIEKNAKVLKREEKAATAGKLKDGKLAVMQKGDVAPWGATLILKEESSPSHKGFELWLGSVDDAINVDALRDRNVTAMVNMSVSECKAEQKTRLNMAGRHAAFNGREDQFWKKVEFTSDWYRRCLAQDDFWYLSLDTEDHFDYPLNDTFDEVAEFVNACRLDGRRVLVHCIVGMNRSAFATAAFLMRMGLSKGEDGLDVKAAVDWVSSRRLDVMKNQSFLKQLIAYGQPDTAGERQASASSSMTRAVTPCLLAQSSVQHKPAPLPVPSVFRDRRPSNETDRDRRNSDAASLLGTPIPYKTPIKLLGGDTAQQLKLSPLCPSTEAVARIFVRNPAETSLRPRRLLNTSQEFSEESSLGAGAAAAALSSTLRGQASDWKVSNSRTASLRSRSTGAMGYNAGPRRALAMHYESTKMKQRGSGGDVGHASAAAVAC